jgi:hypothetical protein
MTRDKEAARHALVGFFAAVGRDVPDDSFAVASADEHTRYALYMQALSDISPSHDRSAISAILSDPDEAMRESVLVHFVDKRAQILSPRDFLEWGASMSDLVGSSPFLLRRLEESGLLKQAELGSFLSENQVLESSDWMQMKLIEVTRSSTMLNLLARRGRTKRIRQAASTRLSS